MTKVLSVASSYSVQPEEKLVTISRIKASSCPFRYFKEYIERPKCSKSFESIELGMGQFFHSYVENHFQRILARNGLISRYDTLDIDDLITTFRLSFIWEGGLRTPYKIVRYKYGLEDFISRLERIATNFNCFLVKNLKNHKVKAIEGKLQIRTDLYYIRGKYDLITEDSDGSLMLWDWKTGSMPKLEYYEDFSNQNIRQFQTTYVIGVVGILSAQPIRIYWLQLMYHQKIQTIVFPIQNLKSILKNHAS